MPDGSIAAMLDLAWWQLAGVALAVGLAAFWFFYRNRVRFRDEGPTRRAEPTAADRWREEHWRNCPKQEAGAGTFMYNGVRIRLCPGFEESYYSTVGDPVTHFVVICNACGASGEGTQS